MERIGMTHILYFCLKQKMASIEYFTSVFKFNSWSLSFYCFLQLPPNKVKENTLILFIQGLRMVSQKSCFTMGIMQVIKLHVGQVKFCLLILLSSCVYLSLIKYNKNIIRQSWIDVRFKSSKTFIKNQKNPLMDYS